MAKKLRVVARPVNNLETVAEYKAFIMGLYGSMGGSEPEPSEERWQEMHAEFLKDRKPEAPGKTW
jgi:hypothetical protein